MTYENTDLHHADKFDLEKNLLLVVDVGIRARRTPSASKLPGLFRKRNLSGLEKHVISAIRVI